MGEGGDGRGEEMGEVRRWVRGDGRGGDGRGRDE